VRRDVTQDSDRTHYYSQYWIDVALGRDKSTGSAATATHAESDIDDLAGSDALLMDEISPRLERSERNERAERVEPKAKPPTRPTEPKKPETSGRPTITSFADLANIANIDMLMKSSAEMDDDVTPDIEAATPDVSAPAVADYTLDAESPADVETPAAEEAESDTFDLGYDDEDEDEDGWSSRRKSKQPKPKRRERRDY